MAAPRIEPDESLITTIGTVVKAATGAIGDVFSPDLRRYLLQSLGLTLLLLLGVWALLTRLVDWLAGNVTLMNDYPALDIITVVLAGAGLFIGILFLIPPVSAIVAGFFLDDVAAAVERRCDPLGAPGKPLPTGQAILAGLRFAVLSLGVNLVALLLLLVPGVNLVAFLGANAYLSGREYFELAASRFMPMDAARTLRSQKTGPVYLGGLVVALLMLLPVINLVTPLFATALMVRIHKRIQPV